MSRDSEADILMAEDSADDAELTLEALSQNNMATRIVHVRDGAEALDYLHRSGRFACRQGPNPVMLLLDLKMPKVNGIEVIRDMKGTPDLADIPIVVLSSSREERDLKEARELGASAYVVKPVRFDDFVDAVKIIGKFWGGLNILADRAVATDSERSNYTSK